VTSAKALTIPTITTWNRLGGRHDFGTRVLKKTGNLKLVMETMGHVDVKTAMKYQHPELEIVRSALNDMNNAVMPTGT
jgi:site-specific recombinase XerD